MNIEIGTHRAHLDSFFEEFLLKHLSSFVG